MISRLVTVDLILTMFQRLHLLPELSGFDLKTLYDVSKDVLDQWAKRIEAEGLSVSLAAITENSLLCYSSPNNQRELADIGDRLIDSASQIELFLHGDRWTQPGEIQYLKELEAATNSGNAVKWFEAAKRITGSRNSTEASNLVRELFSFKLNELGEAEAPTLRQFLTRGSSGEEPEVPEGLIELLKRDLPGFRLMRNIYKKSKK